MLVIKSMMTLMTHITYDIIICLIDILIMAYMAKIRLFKRNSLDDDGTYIIYSIWFAKILLK